MAKYPCRNCVYSLTCGDDTRTKPCPGRKTKSEEDRHPYTTMWGGQLRDTLPNGARYYFGGR